MSVELTCRQRKLSLQQSVTITETQQPIKIQRWRTTVQMDTPTKHLLYLRKHCRSRDRKIISQKIREIVVRLCLLAVSEGTLIQSHQHDCPNTRWTKMTAMDTPKSMAKSPRSPNYTWTTDNREKLRVRAVVFDTRAWHKCLAYSLHYCCGLVLVGTQSYSAWSQTHSLNGMQLKG